MTVYERIARHVGPLSYGAKLLINKHPELSEETAAEILKGVPRRDQAYALANYMEDGDLSGFIKASVVKNKDKGLLKQQMKGRMQGVQDVLGDTEKQILDAKAQYKEMTEMLTKDNHNTFDFSSMMPNLENLITRYDKSPSKALGILNNMKADIELGKGTMNVRTALEFRQDLNYLINRATRYKEKELLGQIKTGVDGFIKRNLDDAKLTQVDDAITNYSRAMNNSDFLEIMNKKNITNNSITDWVAFKNALKKEKLSSPEVDKALDIVDVLATKFKADGKLRSATVMKGQSDTALTALGVRSWFIQKILDPLDTIFVQSTRHRELTIQSEILKSIRNAKNPREMVSQITKNKNIPEAAKTVINRDLNELLQITYKPNRAISNTIDGDVRTLYATQNGTVSNTVEGGLARENLNAQISQPALPVPRGPREASVTELDSGATKYVDPTGRTSVDIDLASPAPFQATTRTVDVNNVLAEVKANQQGLGVSTRLRLADNKTAKYGKGLTDQQLNLDREKSKNAIDLIIEKSRNERLSRRDRETLIKGLARVRQIDRELDIRGYDANNFMSTPRGQQTELDRPVPRYRIRRGGTDIEAPVANPAPVPRPRPRTNSTVPPAEELEPVFQRLGRERGINITAVRNAPNSPHMKIYIEGGGTVTFYRRASWLAFNTTNFRNGSGLGGKFYQTVFDVSRELNIPYKADNGLTQVNGVRLPINIYKYKLETGYNPLQNQAQLTNLVNSAIKTINNKLRSLGRTNGLSGLTERDIETMGGKLGGNGAYRLGPNSLRLYKQMEEILRNGGTLSLVLLAPLLDLAFEEAAENIN
jgi:hypothetical protein